MRSAVILQSVTRGHFGRCLFQVRCREVLHELTAVEVEGTFTKPTVLVDRARVVRAAVTLQSVSRGHFGRGLFQMRCSEITRELLGISQ